MYKLGVWVGNKHGLCRQAGRAFSTPAAIAMPSLNPQVRGQLAVQCSQLPSTPVQSRQGHKVWGFLCRQLGWWLSVPPLQRSRRGVGPGTHVQLVHGRNPAGAATKRPIVNYRGAACIGFLFRGSQQVSTLDPTAALPCCRVWRAEWRAEYTP